MRTISNPGGMVGEGMEGVTSVACGEVLVGEGGAGLQVAVGGELVIPVAVTVALSAVAVAGTGVNIGPEPHPASSAFKNSMAAKRIARVESRPLR
jgi:hypothetical protein